MINMQSSCNTNKLNINRSIDNSASILNKDGKVDDKSNNTKNSINTDTVNISDTNKNLTTAQKAKKAIDDTLSEFKDVDCSPYYDMTGPIADMMVLMDINGIHPVPNDILSNSNSNEDAGSFIDFANNLKALAEKNLDKVPPSFLNFCDKLKQNLVINGLS
ncbi:hypothetical protein KYB31_05775 [Clostridium felsineum]|uniref:hypothetical protein n=1 Tax=Clostridium felsineum TaxID=36839 RepID=UPI00214D2E8D|nr:hypothetical protein [Clostridium felsineum]MCR3758504.1 hypothetical protein [Clostridium felsineum]